jgi:hypothetical protein
MRKILTTGIILAIFLAGTMLSGCAEPATPEPEPTEPPATSVTEEASRQMALDFLKSSPTYLYDGIEDTIKLAETMTLRCPSCWTFIYEFDSRHAGYGDRTGQIVAQVITPHRTAITVQQGNVTQAIMDEKWDMFFQAMIMSEEEGLKIAEDFLRNSPTFKFDGIDGSIKHVKTLEAFCPYCWGFVFEFECAAAGYGDRTGQQLAQVITAHSAVISVSQGKVDGGVIDDTWDMLEQQEITVPEITTAVHE